MNGRFKSRFGILAAVLLPVCLITVFAGCSVKPNTYNGLCMGSVLSAGLYGDNTQELWSELTEAADNTDRLLSVNIENSDIAILNRDGSVMAKDETVKVMTQAVTACNLTDRALDITLGRVTSLWGFGTDTPSLPDKDDIEDALRYADIEGIAVNEATGRITVSEGQKIDLGAVGKGAGCDAMYEVLLYQNKPACISLGGTVLLYGENPNAKGWRVGIRHPWGNSGDYFAVLTLTVPTVTNALFVSTSGSYEKQFTDNGVTYHHILNPKTGYPAENDLVSVTVVSESGVNSDALSTACFVGGLNDTTLQWLKNYGAEAVFVTKNGEYYVTDGLTDCFSLTSKSGFSPLNYEKQ